MSTRSAIAMKVDNGYKAIYCHYDGYPEGVGAILKEHYTDLDKVEELIALGDISSLGKEVHIPEGVEHSFDKRVEGITTAYMRDRGEMDCEAQLYKTVSDVKSAIDNQYLYVFEDGKWTCEGKDY
jgi:hypothetical protein